MNCSSAPITISAFSPGDNGLVYDQSGASQNNSLLGNTGIIENRTDTIAKIQLTKEYYDSNNLKGQTYFICIKNENDQWRHVGNSSLQQIIFAEPKRETILPPALQVCSYSMSHSL